MKNQKSPEHSTTQILPIAEFKRELTAVPKTAVLDKINERDYAIEQAHEHGDLSDKTYEKFLEETDKIFEQNVELVAA